MPSRGVVTASVGSGNEDVQRPPPVHLTKEYIRAAFRLLEQPDGVEDRDRFFQRYMVANVRWEITGSGHALAGTRNSLADHSAASFSRLGACLFFFVFFWSGLVM